MIEFRCKLRDKTRTPIVRNEVVREYAESLVGDYKPNLLKEPGKVNGIHFIENYLGASVDYQDIYYNEGESPIAGATVFNDDRILVFDREGLCVNTITVKANTIILDNATVEEGKDGFANFTALHEGGHFCIHPEVYQHNANQISLFAPVADGSNVVCCRKSTLEGAGGNFNRNLTPEQNREHQANVFAAYAAMPRQTFIPYAKELIRDAGFENGVFIYDDKDWESDYALEKIVNTLRETYGVSFTAAKIHLKELELLLTKYQWEEKNAQPTLF